MMKNKQKQSGLTLIEILTVVAVLSILITITIGISSRVEESIKEKKTDVMLKILTAGLEKYYQFWGEFPLMEKNNPTDKLDITDYYSYDESKFKDDIAKSMTVVIPADNKSEYLVNEAVCFSLGKTPGAKDIIKKINPRLRTSKSSNNSYMRLTVDNRDYPLYRIQDAWGNVLRYTYRKTNDSLPLIESAGSDGIFGDGAIGDGNDVSFAEDNITNR